MYVPPAFRVTDDAEIDAFVRDHGFGTLVSHGHDGPMATHLPVELSYDADGGRRLQGHLSKANPQWQQLEESREAMVVFLGPHTYISPTWYDRPNVPTWNYLAVHFYGTTQITVSQGELSSALRTLSEHYEPSTHPPPRFDFDAMPDDLRAADLKGIVGFSMRVKRVDASFKLSQNRDASDRARIVAELRSRGDDASCAVADAMSRAEKAPR